jgi:hypothetical protein
MKDDYNYTETAYSREMEGQNEKDPSDTSDEPEDTAPASAPGIPAVEGAVAVGATGATVIDTPEGIRMYHLLVLKHSMLLQMRTGLVHSKGSVFNFVKKKFNLHGNHAKVYKAFCAMHHLEEE